MSSRQQLAISLTESVRQMRTTSWAGQVVWTEHTWTHTHISQYISLKAFNWQLLLRIRNNVSFADLHMLYRRQLMWLLVCVISESQLFKVASEVRGRAADLPLYRWKWAVWRRWRLRKRLGWISDNVRSVDWVVLLTYQWISSSGRLFFLHHHHHHHHHHHVSVDGIPVALVRVV